MKYLGQIPYDYTRKETPTKFDIDQYVMIVNRNLIARVEYPLVAQRAYGITYKYLVKVDNDLYIVDEDQLVDWQG